MLSQFIHLYDHERAAKASMNAAAWAYFSGAAADEITLRRNRRAWQQMGLAPRVLQDLRGGHTRCRLLGRAWPFPLLVAPMAYQSWAHPHGEVGMALAAAAQACGLVLSHQTSTPLQDVAARFLQDADHGPLWFQLYWQNDREQTLALLSEVEAAGYHALMLTVDAPVHGVRDRERRHGMPLPAGVRAVHWRASAGAPGEGLCAGLADAAPRWDDVAWLIRQTRLPVLLKGITQAQDARLALEVGAAGVVVSNHGGRVLDTMPATAACLPAIVAAVRSVCESAPVLVDGGIRRGTDLFKALALGADAACIGRPAIYGLAHAGAHGVAHVLRLLRDEFAATMTIMGCARLQDIEAAHLCPLSHPLSYPPPCSSAYHFDRSSRHLPSYEHTP